MTLYMSVHVTFALKQCSSNAQCHPFRSLNFTPFPRLFPHIPPNIPSFTIRHILHVLTLSLHPVTHGTDPHVQLSKSWLHDKGTLSHWCFQKSSFNFPILWSFWPGHLDHDQHWKVSRPSQYQPSHIITTNVVFLSNVTFHDTFQMNTSLQPTS